jgi:hypothetical protein
MHPCSEGRSSFRYPVGGLLPVKGVVPEDEIRHPKQPDEHGDECLLVIKNGNTTGTTIGRATGIESFVRDYNEYGIQGMSMGIAVYPYGHKDGAFSAAGDSGAIVVDGQGRIVGMLTGGAGTTESTDVNYVTPYFWLEAYQAGLPRVLPLSLGRNMGSDLRKRSFVKQSLWDASFFLEPQSL